MVKKRNQPEVEVLVQWTNRTVEDAIWEYYHNLAMRYLNFCLEDKTDLEGNALSATEIQSWLGTVEMEFELVNRGRGKEIGLLVQQGDLGLSYNWE
jgi:hypothetical protein